MPKQKKAEASPDPVSQVAPVESVTVTDPCWNCGEQLKDNKCKACGFDKSLVYNLDLEAEQAKERRAKQQALAARQALTT